MVIPLNAKFLKGQTSFYSTFMLSMSDRYWWIVLSWLVSFTKLHFVHLWLYSI